MKKSTLPAVVGQRFLARDGLLGYRCDCGFVTTARTPMALEHGSQGHWRFSHLPAEEALLHTGGQATDE